MGVERGVREMTTHPYTPRPAQLRVMHRRAQKAEGRLERVVSWLKSAEEHDTSSSLWRVFGRAALEEYRK